MAKPKSKADTTQKLPRNAGPNGIRIIEYKQLPLDLRETADSFFQSIATYAADRTIQTYVEAIRVYGDFAIHEGLPTAPASITREHIELFLINLKARGYKHATISNRFRSLKSFFVWCKEHGKIASNPTLGVKAPKVRDTAPPVISVEVLHQLLKACDGTSFVARRDRAMMLLFIDTGARKSELATIKVEGVDLDQREVVVIGKGDIRRTIPIGRKTTQALDRYIRAREKHRASDAEELWLGLAGAMTHSGVANSIKRIANNSGVAGIHPHLFRHTFAHQWLSSGGSEGDLMKIAGWSSRSMVDRYGRSVAAERARKAHRRYSPADNL